MFDAQKCAFEDDLVWTRDYVARYADSVLVEGIIGPVSVACDAHVEKVVRCLAETSVDCLVADLGTEQQSTSVGGARYRRKGTQELTRHLAGARFVLQGTSCLRVNEMHQLATDGIIRVNMCVLGSLDEAGQTAMNHLSSGRETVAAGDFEATESRQYLHDSIEPAASIRAEVMEAVGYPRLSIWGTVPR
jgi:fructose/tagatose bisphosphate aldolase